MTVKEKIGSLAFGIFAVLLLFFVWQTHSLSAEVEKSRLETAATVQKLQDQMDGLKKQNADLLSQNTDLKTQNDALEAQNSLLAQKSQQIRQSASTRASQVPTLGANEIASQIATIAAVDPQQVVSQGENTVMLPKASQAVLETLIVYKGDHDALPSMQAEIKNLHEEFANQQVQVANLVKVISNKDEEMKAQAGQYQAKLDQSALELKLEKKKKYKWGLIAYAAGFVSGVVVRSVFH